jgi:hypothetical protein
MCGEHTCAARSCYGHSRLANSRSNASGHRNAASNRVVGAQEKESDRSLHPPRRIESLQSKRYPPLLQSGGCEGDPPSAEVRHPTPSPGTTTGTQEGFRPAPTQGCVTASPIGWHRPSRATWSCRPSDGARRGCEFDSKKIQRWCLGIGTPCTLQTYPHTHAHTPPPAYTHKHTQSDVLWRAQRASRECAQVCKRRRPFTTSSACCV